MARHRGKGIVGHRLGSVLVVGESVELDCRTGNTLKACTELADGRETHDMNVQSFPKCTPTLSFM